MRGHRRAFFTLPGGCGLPRAAPALTTAGVATGPGSLLEAGQRGGTGAQKESWNGRRE